MQLQERPQGLALETKDAEAAAPDEASLQAHGLYRLGLAYGRLVYRFRWIVLAFWLVGIIVSLPFAATVGDVLKGDSSSDNTESAHVSSLIQHTLHRPPAQVLVVFQSATTPVDDPAYQQEVQQFVSQAQSFPHVIAATSGGVGQDGRTTYIIVSFDQNAQYVEDHLTDFRALLPTGPARVYLTGDPVVDSDFSTITQQDTEHAEVAALPIALVVLLLVFGTLVAATMPLLLALVAVPVALAVIYLIALHVSANIFVLNIASIVGLGISIDYSLFMTRRFRDELAQGRSPRDAVAWTVATSGEAILFSGLTVMIGFCGLLVIGIASMTSFGIGGAVVVASAVLASLTFLPALLGVLGSRVNAWRVPLLGQFSGVAPRSHAAANGTSGETRGFWQRWALWVMRRPVLIVLVVSVALLGLGWPVVSMNLGSPDVSSLPAGLESRQGLEILSAQFPETNEHPITITAQTPDGSSILTPENLARLNHLTQWLSQQPSITETISLTQLPPQQGAPALSEQELMALYTTGSYRQNSQLAQFVASTTAGSLTVITLKSNTVLDSSAGDALIDDLRAGDKAAGQGLIVLVGGDQASDLDFSRYLYGRFPWTILLIVISTYLLLLLMFRSVLLPLKAILMNVLSVSAAYGVLVYVFQWGHISSLLGFTPDGFIDSTIPIVLFCIVFGLSMDYEVFLLNRIREEWLRTQNNRWAVARGLEKTGGVITSAALLFVIVTGAFTFTSLVVTKEIGLGMAVAIIVDATIIRTLLVPATMRLLGRWNWWLPGRPLPPRQEAQPLARAESVAGTD